ncbi:MAG: hypothetical protein KF684_05665 [Phycisphaeraceae bacterium]|nr:hypothetical protein [Phycisphaeraceae bacterium]
MPTIRPVVLVCALLGSGVACAQQQAAPPVPPVPPAPPAPPATTELTDDALWAPGRWTLQLEPSVWWAAMGGDIRVGNGGTKLEFKDFDGDADDPNAAFSLRAMYRKDKWTVMVDGFSLSFDEGDPGAGNGALDFSLWSVDASVGYTAWERSRRRYDQGVGTDTGAAVRVIPYAGLRMIRPDLKTDSAGGSASESELFLHPMVGVRLEIEVSDRFSFDTGFDAGGLDLLGEDAITMDWTVGLRFHPVERVAIQIGFRQMFMNLESDDLEIDGSLGGLMLGVMIRF